MYDFLCSKCNHSFERIVSFSQSENPQECPECKNISANRMPSAPLLGDADRLFAQKKVPDGFKEILRRIDKETPGSRLKETSSIDFSSKQ